MHTPHANVLNVSEFIVIYASSPTQVAPGVVPFTSRGIDTRTPQSASFERRMQSGVKSLKFF